MNNIDFAWQSRFYDRIVRSRKELLTVRNYIRNNIKNWKAEKNCGITKFYDATLGKSINPIEK